MPATLLQTAMPGRCVFPVDYSVMLEPEGGRLAWRFSGRYAFVSDCIKCCARSGGLGACQKPVRFLQHGGYQDVGPGGSRLTIASVVAGAWRFFGWARGELNHFRHPRGADPMSNVFLAAIDPMTFHRHPKTTSNKRRLYSGNPLILFQFISACWARTSDPIAERRWVAEPGEGC